jgi:hypothetical protein
MMDDYQTANITGDIDREALEEFRNIDDVKGYMDQKRSEMDSETNVLQTQYDNIRESVLESMGISQDEFWEMISKVFRGIQDKVNSIYPNATE